MNAPATCATNWYCSESFGFTLTYTRLGETSAAWKSIECGIGALFTTVKSTVSPTVTRSTGPGTCPSKVQASKGTPSVRTIRVCRISSRILWRCVVARGGATASIGAGVAPVPIGASPWSVDLVDEGAGAFAGLQAARPALSANEKRNTAQGIRRMVAVLEWKGSKGRIRARRPGSANLSRKRGNREFHGTRLCGPTETIQPLNPQTSCSVRLRAFVFPR